MPNKTGFKDGNLFGGGGGGSGVYALKDGVKVLTVLADLSADLMGVLCAERRAAGFELIPRYLMSRRFTMARPFSPIRAHRVCKPACKSFLCKANVLQYLGGHYKYIISFIYAMLTINNLIYL